MTAAGSRAAWEVGSSSCLRTPGFQTFDTYPIRSPLVVADFMLPFVRGRTYAEIGSQSGDLAKCLSFHANRVVVVERMRPVCKLLRNRGIEVVCATISKEALAAAAARNKTLLPIADVYYWWMHPGENKPLLTWIADALRARGLAATM